MSSPHTLSDVTVITVSYNSAPVLKQMLSSLPNGVKTIIVDNAGSDGAALNELAQSPAVKILRNEKNLGFGRACNYGASHADTEFLFFLNPDSVVQPGTVEAFLAAAGRHPPQTAFTPRIANSNGSPNFRRRSVLLPRREWLPRGWPEVECEVPVVSGAAIFVRRAYFADVQFDPNIFMYHEDDDWSLRVRAAGGKLVFVPVAHVVHMAGHSSGRDPEITRFKAYHLGVSRVYAMQKHGRPLARIRCLAHAAGGLLSPFLLFSSRKRAKQAGLVAGVWNGLNKKREIE